MKNNEIANVDNSFTSRIIMKIVLFFKNKNNLNNDVIHNKMENSNEWKQDNNMKKHNFRKDLKIKDNKIERLEYLRKIYEGDENCVKEFTYEEIEQLIELYKSESEQLRKEIEQYEQRLNDNK